MTYAILQFNIFIYLLVIFYFIYRICTEYRRTRKIMQWVSVTYIRLYKISHSKILSFHK